MKKIKVLAINSDNDGIGYYRVLNPHSYLNSDEVEVEIRLLSDGTLNLAYEPYVSQFDIIFYNKSLQFPKPEMGQIFVNIVNKYNIKIVFDIDDYWILSPTHLNYKQWKDSGSMKQIEKLIEIAHAVTTTTPLYAKRISEVNPNVYVLENALNPTEYQWDHRNKIPSDKIRFLWGGGISHMPDLRLLKKSFEMFDKDFLEKSQLYLCGFDLRMRTPKGTIKGNPKDNQWTFFEHIFTNNGRWITDKTHKDFLNEYDDTNYGIREDVRHEFYQRRWTKPILTYGTMYQEADVVLAPLKNNMLFNYYKSQLKVIEAGTYKLPIIASNYGSYTLDIEDGVDGFLIDENKPSMWYEKMKWFVDNPSAVVDMGEKLYEKVTSRYSMDIVNQKRIDVYKKIVSNLT